MRDRVESRYRALINDKKALLAAVKNDGRVLRRAIPLLQNDRDVVLAAVNQNGMALAYASEKLKRDEDIVKAAVRQNCEALRYVPDNVRTWGAEEVEQQDPEDVACSADDSRPDPQGCLQYPHGSDGGSSSEEGD